MGIIDNRFQNGGNDNANNNVKNKNFDEEKARKLVKSLLENDSCSFYKNLIPTIDSLSSEDFYHLFRGECDYDFNGPEASQLKRLAYKFDNFYLILNASYKDTNFHKYLMELWEEYPNIQELKTLDKNKISSNLSSNIPNYSSWPNDVKNKLIKLIQNSQLISEKMKEKIETEYKDVDKVLKKLSKIKKEFFNENNNDEENLKNEKKYLKNENVFFKDIERGSF